MEPGRGLTPGQGGEEGEVCVPLGLTHWAGMLGHHTGLRPPVPGTNSQTTCFLLLTPGAQPAPPDPPPHPGGGSALGMKASGSSGSRLGGQKRPRKNKAGVVVDFSGGPKGSQPPDSTYLLALAAIWGLRNGWWVPVRRCLRVGSPLSSPTEPPARLRAELLGCLLLPTQDRLRQR